MSIHGVCANGYGQGYHLPLFFFRKAPFPNEPKNRGSYSDSGDMRITDTGWKTMTLVDGKDRGLKIISEEWSAH